MNVKEVLRSRSIIRRMRKDFGDVVMLTSDVAENEPFIGVFLHDIHKALRGLETTLDLERRPVVKKAKYPGKPVFRKPEGMSGPAFKKKVKAFTEREVDLELLSRNALRFHAHTLGCKEDTEGMTVLQLRKLVEGLLT